MVPDAADPSRRARSARSLRMTMPGGGRGGRIMRRKESASEPDPLLRAAARRIVRLAAQALLVALLPFLVLVKVAVFLYTHQDYSTVLALAGGTACTAAVVTAYAAWAWHRITGRVQLALIARRFALPLVVAYCGYALIYLSSGNAKSESVRAYYASLHPLLRVALSTLILIDGDAVITDLARRRQDYRTLGLPPHHGSRLHQPEAHARRRLQGRSRAVESAGTG